MGYAPDYVLGMWMMLQEKTPSDYVLATGETHSLSEFLEIAFKFFNLDYQKFVRTRQKFIRPSEPTKLCGDSTKARKELGWKTSLSFKEVIYSMCEYSNSKIKTK